MSSKGKHRASDAENTSSEERHPSVNTSPKDTVDGSSDNSPPSDRGGGESQTTNAKRRAWPPNWPPEAKGETSFHRPSNIHIHIADRPFPSTPRPQHQNLARVVRQEAHMDTGVNTPFPDFWKGPDGTEHETTVHLRRAATTSNWFESKPRFMEDTRASLAKKRRPVTPVTSEEFRSPFRSSSSDAGHKRNHARRRTFPPESPPGYPLGYAPDGSQPTMPWGSRRHRPANKHGSSSSEEDDQWIRNHDEPETAMEIIIQHKRDLEEKERTLRKSYEDMVRERDMWKEKCEHNASTVREIIQKEQQENNGGLRTPPAFSGHMPPARRNATWGHRRQLSDIQEVVVPELSFMKPQVVFDQLEPVVIVSRDNSPLERIQTTESTRSGSNSESDETHKGSSSPTSSGSIIGDANNSPPRKVQPEKEYIEALVTENLMFRNQIVGLVEEVGNQAQAKDRLQNEVDELTEKFKAQSEEAAADKEYIKELISANTSVQSQFDELADEARGLAWVALEMKPKLERWESLEDPDKVVRAMNRLQDEIVTMAQAFEENPQDLAAYVATPREEDDYPEDIVLIRQKIAETLQAGAIRFLDKEAEFEELEVIQESSQREIQRLEDALANAVAQLSYEINEEDPAEKDSWKKLYEDNHANYEKLLQKHEVLQNTSVSQQEEYLRMRVGLQANFDRMEREWTEKNKALEKELLERKEQAEVQSLAVRTVVENAQKEYEALKEEKDGYEQKEWELAERKAFLENENLERKQEIQKQLLTTQAQVEEAKKEIEALKDVKLQYELEKRAWTERRTALEEEVRECRQEIQSRSLASQREAEKLREELIALQEIKQQYEQKEREWVVMRAALEKKIRECKKEVENRALDAHVEVEALRKELDELKGVTQQYNQEERKWIEKNSALEEEVRVREQEIESRLQNGQTEVQELRERNDALKEIIQQKQMVESGWVEEKVALDEAMRASKQESQRLLEASQSEVLRLRIQLDTLDKASEALDQDKAGLIARLREEVNKAKVEAEELRQDIKDIRRRSRHASYLPPCQANNSSRPRCDSVGETNWRMGIILALKKRQMMERDVRRREWERHEELRRWKLGSKYPPAHENWKELVAMSVDERWDSDDETVV